MFRPRVLNQFVTPGRVCATNSPTITVASKNVALSGSMHVILTHSTLQAVLVSHFHYRCMGLPAQILAFVLIYFSYLLFHVPFDRGLKVRLFSSPQWRQWVSARKFMPPPSQIFVWWVLDLG